jgi:2-succinyl-5-enolpyruvyl-6-hydroxy-3-cyclohexene-1-carboxylate synthase
MNNAPIFTAKHFSKVYFCAGARNEKLLPFFESSLLEFETDERIAAFKALGRSKMSRRPSIVCTTSGTAVAECLPAALEAKYADIPLIFITADRPKKLHGAGAPQTTNHQDILHSGVNSFIEIDLKSLAELFESLFISNKTNIHFPLHINVLVDDTNDFEFRPTKLNHQDWIPQLTTFLAQHAPTLFLVSHFERDARPLVQLLCDHHVLFYAETLSWGKHLSPIKNETELLKLFHQKKFASVVRLGHTPLSKIWRMLENIHLPVFSLDPRGLPALSHGLYAQVGLDELLALPLPSSNRNFVEPNIEISFENAEQRFLANLQALLPESSLIYLGNSLAIRNFEWVQTKFFKTYGNRGLNGIDGQLSTAIGLAQETNERVYCLLGDQTTLYDFSSLMNLPPNLTLIIINNFGGRIFEKLKMDQRMVLAHNKTFEPIAKALALTYVATTGSTSNHDLIKCLEQHQIIEVLFHSEQEEML